VATDAIARFDGLSGLARASSPELEGIPGIGEARAAQLQAAFDELFGLGQLFVGHAVDHPSQLFDRGA